MSGGTPPTRVFCSGHSLGAGLVRAVHHLPGFLHPQKCTHTSASLMQASACLAARPEAMARRWSCIGSGFGQTHHHEGVVVVCAAMPTTTALSKMYVVPTCQGCAFGCCSPVHAEAESPALWCTGNTVRCMGCAAVAGC